MSPNKILEISDGYIEEFRETMKGFSEEEFNNYVNSLVLLNLEKDKNLWEDASRKFSEITTSCYKFNRSI
jgi:secreted Zn-dependent insulinase-like peptidase